MEVSLVFFSENSSKFVTTSVPLKLLWDSQRFPLSYEIPDFMKILILLHVSVSDLAVMISNWQGCEELAAAWKWFSSMRLASYISYITNYHQVVINLLMSKVLEQLSRFQDQILLHGSFVFRNMLSTAIKWLIQWKCGLAGIRITSGIIIQFSRLQVVL